MPFLPNAKQRAAAEKLKNADLYLYGQRATPALNLAHNILSEAERRVRCGFKADTFEWAKDANWELYTY